MKSTQSTNNICSESEQNEILDMQAIIKQNHDTAQQIFEFLSYLLTSFYDKQQQRYIISFAKHVYRWARISSYQIQNFGQHTNNKKISKLMNSFSNEFNNKYLPPISNSKFYEMYPSNALKDLISKHITPKPIVPIPVCIPQTRKQKVLLLIDYDDTIIPSTMIKLKNHNINYNNTTFCERMELDKYMEALNNFLDILLETFDYNKNRNITILTNASLLWVKEESMFNSGVLFALKMKQFAEKISKYKIDIISAFDNWIRACKYYKNGFRAVAPYKWKWKIMSALYQEHFGKILNGMFDVKIISIGDSYKSEYQGAAVAFNNYLSKQNINKTKHTKISLHRIKFIENPTICELTRQLIWCAQNIKSIVKTKHKSENYILKHKI